ncbi:cytochrome P450 [Yoonia maricola]|uniref:Cytochrome P450 n=1 Tax=Yoonia maricola TaxID=420999 RepID=A0A2M8WQ44_9RHOB|nr:cytochrome P450 [Yoonia maricola]PJI93058.1 cytochrome P450 [Yoonia maricola]
MTELIRTTGTPLIEAWLSSPCHVLYHLAKAKPGQNLDIELGGAVFHLVQDADTAHTILRDRNESFHKYFGSYARLFGESRLTVNGGHWRKLRDYSQSYIVDANADDLVRTARGYFQAACTDLLANSGGVEYPVADVIDFAAAETVSDMVLGFPLKEWGSATLDDVRKILRLASWENFPRPSASGVEQSFLALDAEDAKADLQARFSAILANKAGSEGGTLIADLAQAGPDEVDSFGELATLLFAGFDTTASAITWSMWLLAQDPALQARLRASVKGMATRQTLTAKEVLALDDLNAFVIEALRIFPPVPVLSRLVVEDMQIDGWSLKKGHRVLLSIIGVQQDSRVFPDPLDVRPQRHPNGALTKDRANHFMPFGDGRRVCPGARFANLEILVALAVILDTMQLDPPAAPKIELRWDASMRQANGTKLAMTALH